MKNKTKERKFNCYKCQYRGQVMGSAHSICRHPAVGEISDNPFANLVGIFASVGRESPFMIGAEKLNIKGNPHGIKNGWFIWPVNFDPTWLDNCDGFKNKEDK